VIGDPEEVAQVPLDSKALVIEYAVNTIKGAVGEPL